MKSRRSGCETVQTQEAVSSTRRIGHAQRALTRGRPPLAFPAGIQLHSRPCQPRGPFGPSARATATAHAGCSSRSTNGTVSSPSRGIPRTRQLAAASASRDSPTPSGSPIRRACWRRCAAGGTDAASNRWAGTRRSRRSPDDWFASGTNRGRLRRSTMKARAHTARSGDWRRRSGASSAAAPARTAISAGRRASKPRA